MKNAIIIHGWPGEDFFNPKEPSPSNNQWFPWLQKQLGLKGITAQTPEMPDAHEPNYEKWKSVFEQFVLTDETILIGHSCGGGFLVRWLSEHTVTIGKLILVAPWIDPEHELGERNTFFEFTIDPKLSTKSKHGVTIFSSTNDDSVILTSVMSIQAAVPGIKLREIENAGHFCIKDGYATFPLLLEEALAS